MFEEILKQAAVIAVLVERTIQGIKTVTGYSLRWPNIQKYVDLSLSIGFSTLGCFLFSVDLLAVVGLALPAQILWVAPLCTGVLIGLGSSIFHDVVAILAMWKVQIKAETESKV